MKTILFLILALCANVARAAPWQASTYGKLELNKCYPNSVLYYFVTQRLGKGAFEIRSNGVASPYRQALFVSKHDRQTDGPVGGFLKLVGKKSVPLQNGFERELPIFQECSG